MNSNSILTMDRLINFLIQLNESPIEAFKKCQFVGKSSQQLSGIIIDNISYFTHDNNENGIQNASKAYNNLLKILKLLRKNFGCWIMTISYGMEYYDGVENSTSHLIK
ncbi:hypothetical protein Kpol_483p1, partial [Vanderwaltozyma polyspora DSM 70294]